MVFFVALFLGLSSLRRGHFFPLQAFGGLFLGLLLGVRSRTGRRLGLARARAYQGPGGDGAPEAREQFQERVERR